MAEGATNRVASDFAWLSAQYGWRGNGAALNVPRFTFWTCSPTARTDHAEESVARIAPRPVLLIAAGNVCPTRLRDHSYRDRFGARPDLVAPGTGHTQVIAGRTMQLWRETVLGFFDENPS